MEGKWMKRIVSAVLILAVALLAGCVEVVEPEKVEKTDGTPVESQQSDDKEAQDQNQTQEQEQEKPKVETFKIGDSVKAGNLIFTVNSTRTDEGNEFIKPGEGKTYYIVDVTVENTGNESEAVSSLMMFKLFDADGYNYSVTFGPETKGSVDGEISPGRKIRGELVFEIPEEATGLELQIDPTVFGSGQIIVNLDK
jgi:GTP-dependent phosphoenolpyruvate carboxykinase